MASIMIFEIIPREIHEWLLDNENDENRIHGLEMLKNILSDLDLKPVSFENMVGLIHLLRRLLDDTNFIVLYGTLQVTRLLIKKLDNNVEKHLKQIVCLALKTLGDWRTIIRNAYMDVFQQLMKIVSPPKVLELVMGHLSHKNSRVREDVLNIVTVAVFTYPRQDFNIPSLCFAVVSCLLDSKKTVHHAALELFTVIDNCLDTDIKKPLMRAIKSVGLNRDAEGLMAGDQVSDQEGLSSASEPGREVRLPSFGEEVSMWTVRASRHPSSTAPSCRSGNRVLTPIIRGSHSPSEQSWSGVDESQAERSLMDSPSVPLNESGPLASVYGQAVPGSLHGSCESPETKSMVRKDKAESFPTPPSSQGPATAAQVFQPPHQPRSPCQPCQQKASVTRRRWEVTYKKTQPSLSDGSDKLFPEKGQKEDAQEQPDLRPIVSPELALTDSLELLSSDDWEKKSAGLTTISSLAGQHSSVLLTRLHDVCIAVIQEVKNIFRSVSCVALVTVRDLCTLQKKMDPELEALAKVVLERAGDSNNFIRQEVNAALDSMVQHGSPTRVINALINGGLRHLNPAVRNCTAQHLADLVEKVGVGCLLSGPEEITDRILPAIAKLAQDSSQEARYFGRRMLLSLASRQDFEKMAEKYLPEKDLVTILAMTAKGLGKLHQDAPSSRGPTSARGPLSSRGPPSARGQPSLPDHALVRASTLARKPVSQANRDHQEFSGRGQVYGMAEKASSVRQMTTLMASKDFRERLKGIDQLVAVCESNPRVVIASLLQVFYLIKDRILESNTKVNLHALEALQKIIPQLKDSMTQVLCFLVPAIIETHLNSKRDAIYNAAVGCINALMQNIDNTQLLQPFCSKARLLKGKAKVDLTEKVADLVTKMHPLKPKTVVKYALPLLWHLLDPSCRGGIVQGATATLCKALYAQMGPALTERASKQSLNVRKGLDKLLKTLPSP